MESNEPKLTLEIKEIDLKTDVDYKGLTNEDFESFKSDMWMLWFESYGGGQPMDLNERFDVYCRARIADWRKNRGLRAT